jgi:rod shape-determining protein MreB
MKDEKNGKKLFVGIDLGTSKTAILASNGYKGEIPTMVGWPKDMIAQKLIKKDILFGDEALKMRLSLDMCKPLEKGILKDDEKEKKAARELLGHAINLARKGKGDSEIFAIVGAPAQTDHINKTTLLEVSREITDNMMVVSEPFAVSYATGLMNNSLIIDMGAGTIDLCRMHGTFPDPSDEISLNKAGDHIDQEIHDRIMNSYKGAGISMNMVQRWKEEFGFVGTPKKRIEVLVPLDGKDKNIDITEEIRGGCESIMDDIINAIKGLISSYDPDFQSEIKKNILLAGRLSRLSGLKEYLEGRLSSLGDVRISLVEDHVFTGARGCMVLAQEMPQEHWNQLKLD